MKRFLLINPFGIGDVLFTTPVIRAIKKHYPDCTIGYWCNERVKDILKDNTRIDLVFALSRGDIKRIYRQSRLKGIYKFFGLLRSIKKHRFDTALDFSLDHRYGFLAMLLGIKERVGFDYKRRGRFLTSKIALEGYTKKHVVEYYLDLLKPLEIPASGRGLELALSDANKRKAKALLKRYGVKEGELLVGIAPAAGASWGKDASLKHWSPIKFARLAQKILHDTDARIIILGDEKESPIADIMVNMIKHKAINLVGRTHLEDLAGIMQSLDLLICNDGGMLHLAVAQGTSTVSIFGPVDEKVYGPYPPGENHVVITQAVPCRPCYVNFRFKGCAHNRRCIKDITVEEVYLAAKNLIERKKG